MGKKAFLHLQRIKPLKDKRKLHTLVPTMLLLLSWMIFSVSAIAETGEYSASQVDKPPKLVRQTPVKYPPQAKRNKTEGRVVVRCLIGVKGKIDKMEIVASEPEGVFDDNALKSLKYWQFRPGVLKGEMVSTWVKVPLNFTPN